MTSESLAYQLKCENLPEEEHIKWIAGHEKLDDFEFHDSKPVHFEITDDTAMLTLRYYDKNVTFQFEHILEFYAEGDPVTDYVHDFSCYPCYHNKQLFTFDIGLYRIICSGISAQSIT